ncbi:MAG: tetratricopeptide repeat protein [Steroidobacteraceae bacterium]
MRSHKTALITFVATSALFAASAARAAAPAECADPKKGEKQEQELSESAYGTVKEATELMSKQKPQEAIDKLLKIADTGSGYEKGLVNYNLGIAYSTKNDYPNAAKSFAKAIATNALPRQQTEQLMYNVGQLYIVTGQYDEGIKALQSYIATACGTVPADAHIFLANALSERKRYQEALPQIDLAMSKAKEVKEVWIQMKLAISYELKDYKACAEALVQLIGRSPDKADYWRQLSSVLYEMKDDTQSVAVLSLAEKQGFLQKPAEIKNLYSVYMMIEAPYKAGALLEDAMAKNRIPSDEANLGSLSDAWINARETDKAETTLKKLASMSEKGDYYYKLGAMYGDNERWKDSQAMLQKAIEKGGLKKTGEAWMRLAVAYYGQKNNPSAITALQKAATFDETRRQAGDWLRVLAAQPN